MDEPIPDLIEHAPAVGLALRELATAVQHRTGLQPRIREIAILMVAQATANHRDWRTHAEAARSAGLTHEDVMRLSMGCFTSEDAVEGAAVWLCQNLLSSGVLTSAEYAEASKLLSLSFILELTVLVGHYRALGQLTDVLEAAMAASSGNLPIGHDKTHAH